MFWGDIIAAHPETIKELPKDIICMTWDYGLAPGDTNVRKLWGKTVHISICVQVFRDGIRRFTYLKLPMRISKKMAVFAHQFDGEGLHDRLGRLWTFSVPRTRTCGHHLWCSIWMESRNSRKEKRSMQIFLLLSMAMHQLLLLRH